MAFPSFRNQIVPFQEAVKGYGDKTLSLLLHFLVSHFGQLSHKGREKGKEKQQ